MNVTKLELAALVIAILVAAASATSPYWFPRGTTLRISLSGDTVESGTSLAFTASVESGGTTISREAISWSVTDGSLDRTTGPNVMFTAPVVTANESVTITASFAGDTQYTSSSDSSQGSVLPPEVVLRTPTVVKVSPSSFSIQSNESQVLNASLTDVSGNALAGKTITWSISPSSVGSLSSATGTSVTYTAPVVDVNTTVTITASFAGDDSYVGSRDSSTGTITAVFALSDLYLMTFNSAVLTNVTFQGPIVVDGMSVTNLTCDLANVSGFSLSHLGLNSSSVVMSDLQLYVTHFKAYSPDSGNTIEITGDQNVSLGPTGSASYMNGSMYVVRISATSANLTRMEAVGERADGSEPYIPSILSAQTAVLTDVSNITGPVAYGDLADRVSNITTGTVDIGQFSLGHPTMYSLDRSSREYNSTNRWLLAASEAMGSNVSVYSIYFKTMVHGGYSITATGDDDISKMIPHAFYSGCSFYVSNLEAHAVYFSADELTLNDFMLSIE